MVSTCTRCGTTRGPDELDYDRDDERAGRIGWLSNGGSHFCPTCTRALLRGLPPIGARSPRR